MAEVLSYGVHVYSSYAVMALVEQVFVDGALRKTDAQLFAWAAAPSRRGPTECQSSSRTQAKRTEFEHVCRSSRSLFISLQTETAHEAFLRNM
jgi:hypothetical protein